MVVWMILECVLRKLATPLVWLSAVVLFLAAGGGSCPEACAEVEW